MCSAQSQDGVSGFELSELMKRRLESVASTGSSASSGFIEDKSYSDSEEEEDGKGEARLSSLQQPLLPLPPSPHLLTQAPLRFLMRRFLLLFSSTITAAGAAVTPLSPWRRLFISCPDLTVAALLDLGSGAALQPCCTLMCYFWFG